jgi:ribosomal protein S19
MASLRIPKSPPPGGGPAIKTQARAVTILPNFVGLKFAIHNGKTYHEVLITEDMVGRKLGEFAMYVAPRTPRRFAVCRLWQDFFC